MLEYKTNRKGWENLRRAKRVTDKASQISQYFGFDLYLSVTLLVLLLLKYFQSNARLKKSDYSSRNTFIYFRPFLI